MLKQRGIHTLEWWARAGRKWTVLAGLIVLLALPLKAAVAFDHTHPAWNALLAEHVQLQRNGSASTIDYAALQRKPQPLRRYLGQLSAVNQAQFAQWSAAQQLAFLINAYNAFTVDIILQRYPDLNSIRDLGWFGRGPWKKKFIPLLGQNVSLDDIEHGMIRQPGRYDDPRIHFAVNCASVGCPMLREEAFVATQLDRQLQQQQQRFLSDPARNLWQQQRLQLSQIFNWYRADFIRSSGSLEAWLLLNASMISPDAALEQALRTATIEIQFQDYDWTLNDQR